MPLNNNNNFSSRGQKRGRGIGNGRGISYRKFYQQYQNQDKTIDSQFSPQYQKPDVNSLKKQAKYLEQELNAVLKSINELKNQDTEAIFSKQNEGIAMKAVVNKRLCNGCEVCTNVCPTGAINVNGTAVIDQSKCIGCGKCVSVCPRGAISLQTHN